MLMKQILSGRRKSNFIIIKDNLYFNGVCVINKFIEEYKRFARIHYLLSELTTTGIAESENLVLHKYFPDPWNLLEGREAELSFDQIVECILSEKSINENTNILFIIDSIASLMQFINLHSLCTSIKKLITSTKKEESSFIQVLCLLHSNLLPDDSKEYKYLAYMATSVITCFNTDHGPSIELEHHQSNGKILKESYTCKKMPTKKELHFEIKKDKPVENTEESHDKMVSTTFKLTLEDKEKESRSQVVLPYLKASTTISKGRIYYEPDVNDDWDDEDPDDDLEI